MIVAQGHGHEVEHGGSAIRFSCEFLGIPVVGTHSTLRRPSVSNQWSEFELAFIKAVLELGAVMQSICRIVSEQMNNSLGVLQSVCNQVLIKNISTGGLYKIILQNFDTHPTFQTYSVKQNEFYIQV